MCSHWLGQSPLDIDLTCKLQTANWNYLILELPGAEKGMLIYLLFIPINVSHEHKDQSS